jgi:hypothetical protein
MVVQRFVVAKVHSHAAAAPINLCEGVARDTLVSYLDPIVKRLLKLLLPPGDAANTVRLFPDCLVSGFKTLSAAPIGAGIRSGAGGDDIGNRCRC